MSEAEKLILTIFGGIIAIAVISVIVGRQSKAPAAISAIGGAMSSIVAAAVNPANNAGNLGNNGANRFSLPAGADPGNVVGSAWGMFNNVQKAIGATQGN